MFLQLRDVQASHGSLKDEVASLRSALKEIESTSTSIRADPADVMDWTDAELMQIESYRSLSERWASLEEDYSKQQEELDLLQAEKIKLLQEVTYT